MIWSGMAAEEPWQSTLMTSAPVPSVGTLLMRMGLPLLVISDSDSSTYAQPEPFV